jgi:hypothetical protein
MEKLSGPVQKARGSSLALNRFAVYAYKPKKKDVSVPFGLETTTSPLLSEILEADASLSESVSNGTDLDTVKIVREYFRLCGFSLE